MKLRPILFSTEMVQAILAGCKTQTRRVVKPQPDGYPCGICTSSTESKDIGAFGFAKDERITANIKCHYGQVGDVLWVRETWAPALGYFAYKADYTAETLALPENKGLWKPSIHMPFEAARIFLQITDIRVERLQDITEEDAKAEGVWPSDRDMTLAQRYYNYCNPSNPQGFSFKVGFELFWQSINGKDSWNANLWVWVIEFERIEKP